MVDITIRPATVEDASGIREVYSHYVSNTAVSFEYDVPSVEEMQGRIAKTIKDGYPYFVCISDGKIVGYSYAAPLKTRVAYKHSVEATIYIAEDYTRDGIGHQLYDQVEKFLRESGIENVYACIAYTDTKDEHLTNRSMYFHEKMGYELVGRFHKCGKKFGKYYDIIWMEKIL